MSLVSVTKSKLDAIADAIRAKTGGQSTMTLDDMPTEIANIPSGDGNTTVSLTSGFVPQGAFRIYDNSWFYVGWNKYSMGVLRSDRTTNITLNPSESGFHLRYVVKFKMNSIGYDQWFRLFSGYADTNIDGLPKIQYDVQAGKLFAQLYYSSSVSPYTYIDYVLTTNTWYYVALNFENSVFTAALYDVDGQLLSSGTQTAPSVQNQDYSIVLGGTTVYNNDFRNGEIDLGETFVEHNGTVIWGKTNSKTQNMGIIS